MRKLGIGKKKKNGKKTSDPETQSGTTIKPQPFKMNKRGHTLKYEGGEIMMQSTKGRLVDKIKAAKSFVSENPEAELIKGKHEEIIVKLDQLEADRKKADKTMKNATKRKDGDAKVQAIKDANALFEELANDIEVIGSKYKLIDLQAHYETEEFDGEIQVGLHPLSAPERESHHVAENKFMEQVKAYYGTVGATLLKKEKFKEIGQKLIDREKGIAGRFQGGKNLSAILIHEKTHRLAAKSVHGIELQPVVIGEMKTDAELERKVVLVGVDSKTKIKRAQMNEGAWNSFLKKAYELTKTDGFKAKDSTTEFLIKSDESNDDALQDISLDLEKQLDVASSMGDREFDTKKDEIVTLINNTTKNAFESALTSGLKTVKEAMKAGDLDGKEESQTKALKKLKSLAIDIWTNNIVEKIT